MLVLCRSGKNISLLCNIPICRSDVIHCVSWDFNLFRNIICRQSGYSIFCGRLIVFKDCFRWIEHREFCLQKTSSTLVRNQITFRKIRFVCALYIVQNNIAFKSTRVKIRVDSVIIFKPDACMKSTKQKVRINAMWLTCAHCISGKDKRYIVLALKLDVALAWHIGSTHHVICKYDRLSVIIRKCAIYISVIVSVDEID